ncbi:LCP family protein required for cell wall assembly [Nakamurella sp. UYEF19]|uniref:LCP family protein n=1 Tax=Nakamurella sp. UYEF19 TaxID=1756392 RepID=UPI003392A729
MRQLARRWLMAGRIIAGALSVLIVLGAIDVLVVGARISHFTIDHTSGAPGETWVVVGSDSRADLPAGTPQAAFGTTDQVAGARADVVLVVHRSPDGRVSTLSLPRDLLMHNRKGQINRLTLAYQVGPQNFVDSLCATLGIPVDHLVVVDFAVFTSIIDVLGGITVDIPNPLRDSYSGLALQQAGTQRLDGDQALALVRSRHTEELVGGTWVAVADGAAQRTSWAGRIFRIVAQRASSSTNPVLLQRLAWTATGSTVADQSTSAADLAEMATEIGEVVDVPSGSTRGGLAVTASAETFTTLAAAGFDRNCH